MDGRSFLPLAEGRPTPWRDHLLYEYYREWAFPHTPPHLHFGVYTLGGARNPLPLLADKT
jgi:hypothetical protein